jgi:hypothetical protein
MVSFLAGLCDLCGEVHPMATPEQRKAVAMDLLGPDAAICVECVARAVAAVDTVVIASGPPPVDATRAPLCGSSGKPN